VDVLVWLVGVVVVPVVVPEVVAPGAVVVGLPAFVVVVEPELPLTPPVAGGALPVVVGAAVDPVLVLVDVGLEVVPLGEAALAAGARFDAAVDPDGEMVAVGAVNWFEVGCAEVAVPEVCEVACGAAEGDAVLVVGRPRLCGLPFRPCRVADA
jgi:hypothetical protein